MYVNRADQAQRHARDRYAADDDTGAFFELQAAQAHATLAVAEQLRIANLIALAKAPDGTQDITPGFSDRAHDLLTGDPGIAAALGVTAKEAKK